MNKYVVNFPEVSVTVYLDDKDVVGMSGEEVLRRVFSEAERTISTLASETAETFYQDFPGRFGCTVEKYVMNWVKV